MRMMWRLLPLLTVVALGCLAAHPALAVTPGGFTGHAAPAPDLPTAARPAALWMPAPIVWLADIIGWGAIGYWIALLGMFVLVAGILFHARAGYWPWWCPLGYLGW